MQVIRYFTFRYVKGTRAIVQHPDPSNVDDPPSAAIDINIHPTLSFTPVLSETYLRGHSPGRSAQ